MKQRSIRKNLFAGQNYPPTGWHLRLNLSGAIAASRDCFAHQAKDVGVSFMNSGQRIEKSRQKRRIPTGKTLPAEQIHSSNDHTYGRTADARRPAFFVTLYLGNLQLDPPASDGYKKLIVDGANTEASGRVICHWNPFTRAVSRQRLKRF